MLVIIYQVSPGAFSLNKIQYYGFHVDDLPHANISRFAALLMLVTVTIDH